MRKGFTLLELLTVLAIVGILFTIGFLNFQSYSREQALASVVRTVKVNLNNARISAIAGSIPNGCSILLNSWQFKVTSATKYEVDASCTVNTIIVTSITLPAGYTISTPVPNPINFKTLAQGTNIPGNGTASILVTQTATNRKTTIVVGANGNVQ